MRVAYSYRSLSDLRELGDWIAKDSPRRALSFVRELRARCRGLADFPERFPVVSQRGEVRVRRCVHGEYVILFCVEERPGAVVILSVVNAARDYNRLLGQLGLGED